MNKYASHARRAQRERWRERSCLRKIGFPSRDIAATQPGMHVYQCPNCRMWHRSASLAKLAARVTRK